MDPSISDKTKVISPFIRAWQISLPVMLAYGSLGIVFGILASQLSEPWYFAPLFSLVVFAGAVQFIALGIFEMKGAFITLFLSTFFIAVRNSFYGLSLLERFKMHPWRKLYVVFGLVDATYAILLANPPLENQPEDVKYVTWLTALIHSYWVIGTLIGSLFSTNLMSIGDLEFVLIAFFSILTFEQYLKNKNAYPFLIATCALLFSLLITPNQLLLTSILFCVAIYLIGFYWKERYA